MASPELVFQQAAKRLSFAQLVMLGDEMCGGYTHAKYEDGSFLRRSGPLSTCELLQDFLSRAQGAHGRNRAKKALPYIVEGSASPMETELEMILCLPKHYGGYGLPRPLMNYRIDFDEEARRLSGRTFALADLCWPDYKLDVEYDSDEWHATQDQSSQDKARANAMNAMEYDVIFVTRDRYNDDVALESIAKRIARRIKHRWRMPANGNTQKREELREEMNRSRRDPLFLNFIVESH